MLLGVAHPMRECWVLAGFVPETRPEVAALDALRKELGFDPTARSHELDASSKTAKRSPKRILERLTGGEVDREARCWTEPDLDHLRQRGRDNGLAAFLSEVEERLAPALSSSFAAESTALDLGCPPVKEDDTGSSAPER
ncbi:hypothetical protein [Sorangium cellulosum]|uniref:hypothetical protein n=1 Tax=Sorangium cellulosum TaxID=56 RepID=UPI001F5D5060|nr:hypothetical protein [Sorangium cellulosum]